MSRTRLWMVAGLAPMALAACDADIAQPELAESPRFAAVAGPRASRAEYEAQLCAGDPMPTNVQPGWPYIFGTEGDDKILAGDAFAVRINARAGNDCLVGGTPNNSLFGEEGGDLLLGGGGGDYLDGGPGADVIFGDDDDDYIRADDGYADVVFAGNGHDIVYAEDGVADEIDCGPGRDMAFVDAIDVVSRCEAVNPEGYF